MGPLLVCGMGQCSWDYLGVLDAYPNPDTKAEAREWSEQGGGPAATALVSLSRLGVPCRFAGVCGEDESGTRIRDSLRNEGLDIQYLKVRAGATSQKAFIAIDASAQTRTIFWTRTTAKPLDADEIPESFLKGARFLLLDGLMVEASLHAAALARRVGIPVMVDAGRLRPGMLELCSLCDYVVGSEEFAKGLGFDGRVEAFREQMTGRFPGVLTVTLGGRGSLTISGGDVLCQASFPVTVRDTTGAGDVFHGGYVYGLLQGWDLKRTLRFASAFAALKCRSVGGRGGIPSLEETLKLLGER